jgi:uncharacterized protein YyaL (SSP411 family)
MERESFEDEEVAEILNEYYIAIKVDREERPDIDHIYMTVCQLLTGRGGWPLTVFMTPGAKPFFVGTYFPKESRMGMPGLIALLENISDIWGKNKDSLISSSENITAMLTGKDIGEDGENDGDGEDSEIDDAIRDVVIKPGADDRQKHDDFSYRSIIDSAYSVLKHDFDHKYGGFGNVPKFPSAHNLYFLLRYWYITGEEYALEMVEKTLKAMYRGGIFDHIGFGFSRYSTDRKWLVPHFEKMLYDNALLAMAYLEAYQATKNIFFSDVAKKIFEYVLRDMRSPGGGFYSAEDADSEGEEGKFYTWIPDEIEKVLGKTRGKKICNIYDISPNGNFEGKSIPNLISKDVSISGEEGRFIEDCRQKLFEYRGKRIHPYKDDKILTSWNGLMIAAMAMGGRVLGEDKYTEAAEKAANFISAKLVNSNGRLMVRYRDRETAYPGYIDDYAFFMWGLLELYETGFNPCYLKKALELSGDMFKLFWDDREGGFFIYGSDAEWLISRPKETYDGAMPSGNSVAAMNLVRLAKLTGKREFSEKALELFMAFKPEIEAYPTAYTFMLLALMLFYQPSVEIVLVPGDDSINGGTRSKNIGNAKLPVNSDDLTGDSTNRIEMLDVIREKFNPFLSVIVYSNKHKEIVDIIPHIKNYKRIGENSTAYVCRNFSCSAPVSSSNELKLLLDE